MVESSRETGSKYSIVYLKVSKWADIQCSFHKKMKIIIQDDEGVNEVYCINHSQYTHVTDTLSLHNVFCSLYINKLRVGKSSRDGNLIRNC